MKKYLNTLLTIVAIGSFTFASHAQTADEIIAKHIKAHGGKENWKAVKSMKLTGQFTSFSTTKKFTTYRVRPNFYYSKFHLGQHPVVEGSDGKTFWTIDPWQEILYPRQVNDAEMNVFIQKAEFCTPFFNYKKRGYTVEYLGQDEVEGVKVHKMKLTRDYGNEETWYLNAETYLEYKMDSYWIDFARAYPAETFFDDFRTVEGLVIPFYLEKQFAHRYRVTEVENVEINVDFDTDKCHFPRSEAMEKLNFLKGNWDIEVTVKTRSGQWYPFGKGSSNFEFKKPNLIQEDITYDRTFRFNKIINYTYNQDSKEYMVTMYNDLHSGISIYKGEFTDSVFTFDNTSFQNLQDTLNQNNPKKKYEFSEMSDDQFTLIYYISRDEGATWLPRDRYVYTRTKE